MFDWEARRTKLDQPWFKKISKVVPTKMPPLFFQIAC